MNDPAQASSSNYIGLAADIVSAYVSNNSVPVSDLPALLSSIHTAISGLAASGSTAVDQDQTEKVTPAQIRKSITHDALISFEDGKSYKTLRRHLTLRGLSPEAYRAKYGLPLDYPMTAAAYSAQRSELARSLGLGRQRNRQTAAKAAEPAETVSIEAEAAKPKRVGRPRKAATA